MRKLILAAILAMFVLSFCAFARYKPFYKLSVVVGPNTGWGMGAAKFAELVEKYTEGRVKIKVYYGGQLFAGKQTNEFLLLRTGVADFALGSTINWSPQVKCLNIFCLPFLFGKGYKYIDAAEYGKTGEAIFNHLRRLGVEPLAWGENGFRELTNRVRPIHSPKDLEGLKIRVVGSKLFIDTFKALGANPTIMNWGEAVTAFQQGLVDGQENPIVGVIIPYRVYEYHKYLTFWHYAIDPLILAVNGRVWRSFSEKDKEAIRRAAKEAMLYQKALVRIGLDDGWAKEYLESIGVDIKAYLERIGIEGTTDPFEFLKMKGVTIVRLTPQELDEFYRKTESVRKKWAEVIKRDIGVDLVELAEEDMESVK